MTEQLTAEAGVKDTAVGHKVVIEVFGWLTGYVGGNGSGSRILSQEFSPGESLRTVVLQLSLGYPSLCQHMWDSKSGQLGPNVEILVNGTYLGITRSMDSEAQDGDRITLMERSA